MLCEDHFTREGQRAARQGSTLVAVLVVLGIVGALSMQGFYSLATLRRSQSQRSRLLQSREIVDLARYYVESKVATQHNGRLNDEDWQLEVSPVKVAQVSIRYKDNPANESIEYRIVVKLTVKEQSNEHVNDYCTTTWQSESWDEASS